MRSVDPATAARAIALFEGRGQLDRVEHADASTARICLDRARMRLTATEVLIEAALWESAYTAAYDAYRTAADAVLLLLGYRVPATQGGHRIATDIAHAVLQADTDAFLPAVAERIRRGRHESEYFDPDRPSDKTAEDAGWAQALARRAIQAVDQAVSAG